MTPISILTPISIQALTPISIQALTPIFDTDFMPRQAGIDAPGALHHIICRGYRATKHF
jgi:hypothetical protein